MITDEMIDQSSARFFCLFKDKQFMSKLRSTLSSKNKQTGKKLMKNAVAGAPSGTVNEAFIFAPLAIPAVQYVAGAICALGASYFGSQALTIAANELASGTGSTAAASAASAALDAAPVDPAMYASHINTVHRATAPIAAQPPIAAPFPAYAPQLTFSQETAEIAGSAASAASNTPAPKKGKSPWWKMILSWLGGAVTGFLTWLAALLAQLGIIVSVEALAGILAGLAAIASYITPRIMLWVKRCMKGKVVAEVQFKTVSGDELNLWYSYKDFMWHCNYLGARLASKTKVPFEDIGSLLKTDFFKKFQNECIRTVGSVFNDDDMFTAAAAAALLLEDEDEQEEYKEILKSRERIMNGLRDVKIAA